jgi:tungstate transport system ATP-binding protein
MLRRSVAANVAYALALRRVPRRERAARTDDVLAWTDLRRLADQPVRVLSVGEQQKLALARTWALAPQVLFLDEPTASLDPAATRTVENIVLAIRGSGTKIIMTTHDLAQARRVAGEVLFLHRGRLYEQTPADRFFTAPKSAEAQHFIEGKLLGKQRRILAC